LIIEVQAKMARTLSVVLITSLIAFVALCSVAYAEAPEQGDVSYVHVSKMVVEPSGADLNFTVYYNTTFFTRFCSFLFGAKIMQPSVIGVFNNFSNVSIVSIDPTDGIAKITVKNLSRMTTGGWYVYDNETTFTVHVDELDITGISREKPMVEQNVNNMPMFSYRA
jgi:hypothetical protein